MENPDTFLQEKVLSLLKANKFISAVFLSGVIFLVIGLIQFLIPHNSNTIEFQKGGLLEGSTLSAQPEKILVDVSGEVEKPGVYSLDSTARIQDALVAAGGLGPQADRSYVAKSINLASMLRDGVKIYVPKVGEIVSAPAVSNIGITTDTVAGVNSGQVSINSGSESELVALPGIGPVTAGKIISGRPYRSIDELVGKKIVGQSVYRKIKDLISL